MLIQKVLPFATEFYFMRLRQPARFSFFSVVCILLLSALPATQPPNPSQKFPYKEEGLTDRQAAAHLLNRFTYGPRPGEVDELLSVGLEKWVEQQLQGNIPDQALAERLRDYDVLNMSNAEINRNFPRPLQVARLAKAEGIITDDSLQVKDEKKYRQLLSDYSASKKFRPQAEVFRQFFNAKVLRASYSKNQLHEVLTEFWFNHFNVSISKRPCALFVPVYERDAIRPFVTGKFSDMLLATAKSPAMLIYLDNFSSNGDNDGFDDGRGARRLEMAQNRLKKGDTSANKIIRQFQQARKNKGLNENYAREVMELHTLGVDGGYTQQDVTEAARVLTGWTLYPMEDGPGSVFLRLFERFGEENLMKKGFVREGDFLFAMSRHDDRTKTVLGKTFPGNGGYQEGVDLLQMLASHPSTAKFISRKLAIRFVQDDPPAALVDKMAKTFSETNGKIRDVLRTMLYSREFWSPRAVRSKTKSPFELVVSAVRALNAEVEAPFQLFTITDRMGQKLYHYAAPTGFPDQAAYWINSGALLNRMNFGMSIASQQIRGIKVNLLELNRQHEPESAQDALMTYCRLLLPERDPEPTIRRLTPVLTDPSIQGRLQMAPMNAKKAKDAKDEDDVVEILSEQEQARQKKLQERAERQTQLMLAQVVGILLGSPEFQRR